VIERCHRKSLTFGLSWTRALKALCVLKALRWLSRQGQLEWPLEGIQHAPTAGTRKQQRSQAVVIEPPMLSYLEDAIEENVRLNNTNWRRLLGSTGGSTG
jgi:hypothetical protein